MITLPILTCLHACFQFRCCIWSLIHHELSVCPEWQMRVQSPSLACGALFPCIPCWRGEPLSLHGLGTFVENKLILGVWADFWALCSVPLILVSLITLWPHCFCHHGSVVHPEVRPRVASGLILFAEDSFICSESLVKKQKFEVLYLLLCDK